MLRHLLLDLDETLYAPDTGLWDALRERINQYMMERLGVPPAEVHMRREDYYARYGSSLAGMQHDYDMDADEYLAFVHAVPLEDYLRPAPALNAMLARLPLPKAIFTNADAAHAQRVLNQLGVARHFNPIIDLTALGFHNKPHPEAYARALELLKAQPTECLFADDALRNLKPAQALGMVTVLVTPTPPADLSGADYHIPDILGLERVVGGLLGQVF